MVLGSIGLEVSRLVVGVLLKVTPEEVKVAGRNHGFCSEFKVEGERFKLLDVQQDNEKTTELGPA